MVRHRKNFQNIAKFRNGNEDGFDIVKTISAFLGDVKAKVNFGVWEGNHCNGFYYANMAAPIIPASFRFVAGTIGVFSESDGSNFSNFLLVPPPIMKSSG